MFDLINKLKDIDNFFQKAVSRHHRKYPKIEPKVVKIFIEKDKSSAVLGLAEEFELMLNNSKQ